MQFTNKDTALYSYSKVNQRTMNQQGQTGKRIQDYIYNYNDFIGNGNFSKCYKATNTRTQQNVAIKIVALDSLKSRRLEELLHSEIQILKQLDHPNVLRCFQVFSSNRNCYIITELCNQGDLQSLFKRRGQNLSEKEIRAIVADIFSGLTYLASKGIVHRDLKIANVFMHNDVAKIADFGFAAQCNGIFKDLNIGSPLYMSPQGIHNNLYGPKTDVWAFGVMIYELYHGRTPFSHCVTEKDLKMGVSKPIRWEDLKSSIPNDAKELIVACMQISQEKRPTIQQLNGLTFIKQSMKPQNHQKQIILDTPLRQNMLKKNPSSQQAPRTRDRNSFKSVQQPRLVERSVTPQRVIFNGSLLNSSLQLKPYNRYGDHSWFNQTFSHPLHSPQAKRANISPAKVSGTGYSNGLIVTPFQINQRHLNMVQLPEAKSQRYMEQISKEPYLISAAINFKQSVSILHYCRLIFKFLTFFKEVSNLSETVERKYYATLGFFLMSSLEEMHEEVLKKRIKYEGNNSQLRQKKLFEVLQEYRKKYRLQLDQNIITSAFSQNQKIELNLTLLKNSIQRHISGSKVSQSSSNSELIAAQLQLILLTSTSMLLGCYLSRNYSKLHRNRSIEDVLNRSKDTFTYPGYLKQKQNTITTMVKSS